MNEFSIVKNKIEDLLLKFDEYDYFDNSDFLSLDEQSLLNGILKAENGKIVASSGYLEGERKIFFFVPKYLGINSEENLLNYLYIHEEDNPIEVLRIDIPKNIDKKLSHRDFLGAILGLGIKREKVGDILMHDNYAQVILSKNISEYVKNNLNYVGRVAVKCKLESISNINVGDIRTEDVTISVSSIRLDNIVSDAFKISRNIAKDCIIKGIVFVNGIIITKPDYYLKDDSKIVLRGKGKIIYKGITGESKKGNKYVSIVKYI